jgi:hypothetical protein
MVALIVLFSGAFAVGILFMSEAARFTADQGVSSQADKAKEAGLKSHLFAEEDKVDAMTAELQRAQHEIAFEKRQVTKDEGDLKRWEKPGQYRTNKKASGLRAHAAHRVYKPLHHT